MMMNQMNNNINMNNNEMMGNSIMMNQMPMMNQMMGMNNNIMNNMNMDTMNQTTNIMMDESALRIKNIIKPYEEKIKELEETIRQNYLKIAILNDKLKQNKNNQMLMMNNNDIDIIELIFQMNLMNSSKIKCLKDELMDSVINRYCKKNFCDRNSHQFFYMGILINKNLTASEVGLMNGSIITVEFQSQLFNMNLNMMNNYAMDNIGIPFNNNLNNLNNFDNNTEKRINLIFDYKGEKTIVFLGESSSIKDGLNGFIQKRGIAENVAKNLSFFYNNRKLLLTDERQLKEVFGPSLARIIVI
jgi:hypothetical protein